MRRYWLLPDTRDNNPSSESDTKDWDIWPTKRSILDLLIGDLLRNDVVVVTASGNDFKRARQDKPYDYPAALGPTMDVIVVGAVDITGQRAYYSVGTEDQLTVSALGDALCAWASRVMPMRTTQGTSNAAAVVSGVIALWLSQPEYKDRLQVPGKAAANVKKMVEEMAYRRAKNGPTVIWNGMGTDHVECGARIQVSNLIVEMSLYLEELPTSRCVLATTSETLSSSPLATMPWEPCLERQKMSLLWTDTDKKQCSATQELSLSPNMPYKITVTRQQRTLS
ncbi:hypothetical protein CSUB01_12370 [Colletotrichum sublineola]|uniref:Peptidase S8/S53 domain-containing protein n=1 Tax=Colletotrichum sublineola TaxID=1173701 RepID=A0A066Y165_COLSU|nr:hypothetical protein CSUB01_12370 [Colletotrichum sublineola]